MRKKDLQEAKANLKAYVREKITKREVLQVRCEEELVGRLLDLAAKREVPMSTMLREWIVERLDNETKTTDDQVSALQDIETRIRKLRAAMIAQRGKEQPRTTKPHSKKTKTKK